MNMNKDDEFGRSFINTRNNNGPIGQTLVELHDFEEEEEVIKTNSYWYRKTLQSKS